MAEFTVARLREVLHYDPATGAFTSLVTRSSRAPAGTVAGSLNGANGYVYVSIDGKRYLAHRLAWFYVHGKWPPEQIDHRDADRANNRWANLRPATPTQNHGNARRLTRNTSGFKGVCWDRGRWKAQIAINGKPIHLGHFNTPEAAHAAYCAAAAAAFGEFARTG